MEVTVDSEQLVEIPEPESNQTLGEYVEKLNEKLSEVNRFIYSVEVDDEQITEAKQQKKCAEFDRLQVDARSFEAMAVDSIGQLGEYCQNFLASLPEVVNNWSEKETETKDQYRQQVLEAFELSGEVLEAIDSLINVASTETEPLTERVQELEGKLREAGREELKNLLKEECRDFFTELLEALESILNDLETREGKISEQINTLQEKVSTLLDDLPELIQTLQGGEEVEGYEDIDKRAEDINKIIRIISIFDRAGLIKKSFSPEEQEKLIGIHTELTAGFDDLQEAIENNDLIMICDILEYEVLPYLETIEELFGSSSMNT